MASRATTGGASAPPVPPLDVLLSAIPGLPRPVLARLTARLIDRMDEIDPDPDVEANGDEEDGSFAEDDWHHSQGFGAGCPIADPGGGNAEDEGEPNDGDAEPDSPEVRRPYIARTRRRACIATRCRHTGTIYRYDLIREPVAPTKRQLLRSKRTRSAKRRR